MLFKNFLFPYVTGILSTRFVRITFTWLKHNQLSQTEKFWQPKVTINNRCFYLPVTDRLPSIRWEGVCNRTFVGYAAHVVHIAMDIQKLCNLR